MAPTAASESASNARRLAAGAVAWVRSQHQDPVDPSIYGGIGGTTLFLLQAGENELAAANADELAAGLVEQPVAGLYVGIAGSAFVLQECGRALGSDRWQAAVRGGVIELAKRADGGVWSTVTDIIAGSAGTGLALLSLHEESGDEQALELAVAAADALVALGEDAPGGRSWAMDPSYPRLMPNFSHGTAGVAYFLAAVAVRTDRADLLEAALAGAGHLLDLAKTEGDTCLVHHNSPDGLDLYYLGWCHGPVGTARLFEQLHVATGDSRWRAWLERSARSLLLSGIPQQRSDGFWENVGQCCGNAGVVEFCLDVAARTPSIAGELAALAGALVDDIEDRAVTDEAGTRWPHAEGRVRPDEITAPVGFMQGAAGIGAALLRCADHLDGDAEPARVRLPDNPF
jgi:lantibiotic modifying enzyme